MNKIACFSAGGGIALENFNKTVAKSVPLKNLDDLEIDNSYKSVSVWGMRETERNKFLWEKLNTGVIVLL